MSPSCFADTLRMLQVLHSILLSRETGTYSDSDSDFMEDLKTSIFVKANNYEERYVKLCPSPLRA